MRQLGNHIVAGMGFAEGDDSVFRQVFTEMGIDSRHIFTATSREEILQAFSLFRQSALELTARSTTVRRIYEG